MRFWRCNYLNIGSAQNIRDLDSYCIKKLGIPGIVLMENAALKILKHIESNKFKNYIIVCGKGNNGGDGLVVARHLMSQGMQVKIFIVGNNNPSEDFLINYNILKNIKANIIEIKGEEELNILRNSIKENSFVLDGIFGTGLKRKVEGLFKEVISIINEESNYTLAIDIPSGLHSDSGKILGVAVKANKTISFVMYKRGFFSYDARNYIGQVVVESIGMPQIALETINEKETYVEKEFIYKNLKKRDPLAHKGDFGRVLIFAGSRGFTGASVIATKSAVKSGAGLVTVCTEEDVLESVSSRLLEAMSIANNSKSIEEYIKKADAIAIGPGMGNKSETLNVVKKVLRHRNCPVIIDADGINVLKDNLELLTMENKYPIILTPHLGEFSRILGKDIGEIKEYRLDMAKEFSKKYGVILLLKGFNTVITNGEELYINSTGNSAMANGGMGDCLTGIIASLIGQGYEPLKATAMAAFIHGYIGERLSVQQFVVTAEDIINNLPKFIKELLNNL